MKNAKSARADPLPLLIVALAVAKNQLGISFWLALLFLKNDN